MTTEITIGLTIIGCVLIFAPIHWAHVIDKRRMQRDHDAEVQDLGRIVTKRDQQLHDMETLLTVAAAEIERLSLGARAPKVTYLAERRAR